MPELPEVEIIRLGLQRKIIGLKIKKIEILNQKTFQGDPKLIEGKTIKSVWRKAKVLGMDLDNNLSLMFHLKMSGQIILIGGRQQNTGTRFIGGHPTKDMGSGELPNRSTRVIFALSNELKLYFNDQRKFGWVRVVRSSELVAQRFLSTLGPEPLEKGFNWEILKTNLLKHKAMPVKVALMDQSVVSGVGNIYASEALFLAKIDPKRKASALSDDEFKRLYSGVIESLTKGIRHGGSSKTHFVNAEGEKGLFLNYAFVYNRAGKPCQVCKEKIKKITLGGRGTFYCPDCQKN